MLGNSSEVTLQMSDFKRRGIRDRGSLGGVKLNLEYVRGFA